MRFNFSIILVIVIFSQLSCIVKCPRPMKLTLSDTSSTLIFDDFRDSRISNLRLYNDSFCNLIYNNKLYELNLNSNNYRILFSNDLIENIDFIKIANKGLKSDSFSKVNQKDLNLNLSTNKFDELLNNRKLINFWRLDTSLFLIYQISTPKVEIEKIIADNTYFIIEFTKNSVKKITPILDNSMPLYINYDGISYYNSELYFSKLELIYKDSLNKYSAQRPNLVVKYNKKSTTLSQVDLRFSRAELERSSQYLTRNNFPYYQFVNTAAFMYIKNDFYLCDNKELFSIDNLTSPKFRNLVNSDDEIVVNLPTSDVDDNDYFLYYTSRRVDSTKSFSFYVSTYSLCENKKVDQIQFNTTSLASNIAIFKNRVYFFRSSDRGLELNTYYFNNAIK